MGMKDGPPTKTIVVRELLFAPYPLKESPLFFKKNKKQNREERRKKNKTKLLKRDRLYKRTATEPNRTRDHDTSPARRKGATAVLTRKFC